MVYRPMSISHRYSNPCLEGNAVMGRPKKQEKLEDIFWAPQVKEYKDTGESKTLLKAKRQRLLKAYLKLYELSGNTVDNKERYILDRLVAKHIPM